MEKRIIMISSLSFLLVMLGVLFFSYGGLAGLAIFDEYVKEIRIEDSGFVPSEVDINPGDKVSWTNYGSRNCVLMFGDEFLESILLSPGNTYEYSFGNACHYTFFCRDSPEIEGIVIIGPEHYIHG